MNELAIKHAMTMTYLEGYRAGINWANQKTVNKEYKEDYVQMADDAVDFIYNDISARARNYERKSGWMRIFRFLNK